VSGLVSKIKTAALLCPDIHIPNGGHSPPNPPAQRGKRGERDLSRKDEWNRKHYDYTTLRTKYDIKERIRTQSEIQNISLNAYITTAIINQLKTDEAALKNAIINKILNNH
jgi:hypothetical protein